RGALLDRQLHAGADNGFDLLFCCSRIGARDAWQATNTNRARASRMSEVSRRGLLNSAAGLAAGLACPLTGCATSDPQLSRLATDRRILLKNAAIVTLDPALGNLATGDLLIEGGKVAQIAPRIDASPETAVIADMSNRIII